MLTKGSKKAAYLINLLQPAMVRCQFCHEGLMLQPLGVQIPRFIIGLVLGCQQLLFDPDG